MVTFLDAPRPLEGLKAGLGEATDALGQFMQRRREQKGREEESEGLEKAGFNVPSGIRDPKLKLALLEQQQKQKEFEADSGNYDTIKDAFGEKFANVWKAAPTGGRTELLRAGIDARLRGYDIKGLFDQLPDEMMPKQAKIVKEEVEFPDYKLNIEGMTPKESISYQKDLRSDNTPILKEANTAKKTAKKALTSYKDLAQISPKIPQGLSRFFYDKEGNIRPLAQTLKLVPPEAEKYVKIINDFTTQAKDSYGSRVTNFDLQQFMRRLPTLANSEEGRNLILERMQLTTEADLIINEALEDVYRHYGAGKITPEDALQIAEQIAEKRLRSIQERSEAIDTEMDSLSPQHGEQGQNSRTSLQEIFG